MNYFHNTKDIPTIVFSFLFIWLMITMCLWILQPFIIGFTWAGMIVIATWPLLLTMEDALWKQRFLAVLVMVLLLILVFIIPIILLINSLIENSGLLITWLNSNNLHAPELLWLQTIPIIGYKCYSYYHHLINSSGVALLSQVQPYIVRTTRFFFTQAEHLGFFMIHLGVMLTFSILLYWHGEKIGKTIHQCAFKLASHDGKEVVLLAMQTIRAVALGVVVTACVQGLLGGIGLSISGIPFSTILTVFIIFSCLVQIGPLVILVPAIIWLYWAGDNTGGTVLLIWSGIVCTLETLLRSMLIKKGADLPIILILSGVIGGVLSFGMIGVFIGPVVLAVAYQFMLSWIKGIPLTSHPTMSSNGEKFKKQKNNC
ncbi:Putative transport protein YdiK [Candidatus Erwinia haradaeae]|uniref:Transport protein YdiK n=1 Tax=Candidatus Erwinia haradaeae TaxID=1922217 RepID=A0A451DD34_9GAMM|nr:AI-2E family transporter YdiK [Candidatus Erwinia haradaeae]VFP84339.1 Putative transport protein YdiK [Candidatus Erwinia haradaeae]